MPRSKKKEEFHFARAGGRYHSIRAASTAGRHGSAVATTARRRPLTSGEGRSGGISGGGARRRRRRRLRRCLRRCWRRRRRRQRRRRPAAPRGFDGHSGVSIDGRFGTQVAGSAEGVARVGILDNKHRRASHFDALESALQSPATAPRLAGPQGHHELLGQRYQTQNAPAWTLQKLLETRANKHDRTSERVEPCDCLLIRKPQKRPFSHQLEHHTVNFKVRWERQQGVGLGQTAESHLRNSPRRVAPND